MEAIASATKENIFLHKLNKIYLIILTIVLIFKKIKNRLLQQLGFLHAN